MCIAGQIYKYLYSYEICIKSYRTFGAQCNYYKVQDNQYMGSDFVQIVSSLWHYYRYYGQQSILVTKATNDFIRHYIT